MCMYVCMYIYIYIYIYRGQMWLYEQSPDHPNSPLTQNNSINIAP